jgi:transcriptional regulator with XRE-family HTH domain
VSPRPVPRVGERLREVRQGRGVSVRALARELGVSASAISQIETGKSQPSVSTLYAMTTALGISVEDVFTVAPSDRPSAGADGTAGSAAEATARGLPGSVLAAIGASRGQRVGPVVRPADRQVLQLDSGVTWERLGQLPHPHVDFLLITYEPGGSSSSESDLMRHGGSEYGYLLSGELVLTLGDDELRLGPEDAISFDSTTPHRYRNDGLEPAVGVWLVIESA